jgi:hypothetical protein
MDLRRRFLSSAELVSLDVFWLWWSRRWVELAGWVHDEVEDKLWSKDATS